METKKVSLRSMDVAGAKRERLKQLFPSVFVETVNEQGELVESVDLERLQAELGTFTESFESRRERYGLDWPGKRDALRIIQEPSVATLKPERKESVRFDQTENLFIEGDNLEVLKLLQKSYYGKIKRSTSIRRTIRGKNSSIPTTTANPWKRTGLRWVSGR